MSRFTTDEEYKEGWRDSDYMVEGKWRVQFSRRLTDSEYAAIDSEGLWDPQVGTFSMQRTIDEVTRVAPDITVVRSKTYDELPAQPYSEWDTEDWTMRVIPQLSDEQYAEANKRMDEECWNDVTLRWDLDKFRGLLEQMFPDMDAMQYRAKV